MPVDKKMAWRLRHRPGREGIQIFCIGVQEKILQKVRIRLKMTTTQSMTWINQYTFIFRDGAKMAENSSRIETLVIKMTRLYKI